MRLVTPMLSLPWKGIAIMVLTGIILGAFGCFFFYQRDIGRINDRLKSIQQQMTPAIPTPDAKPTTGNKGRHGR